MTPAVLRAFATELVKVAKDKVETPIKGPVSWAIDPDPKKQVPGQPPTLKAYETMNRAKWIRTAKDLPAVIGATAVSYGVGRVTADEIAKHFYKNQPVPTWLKHAPAVAALGGNVLSYALGRSREGLRLRREAASEAADKDKAK